MATATKILTITRCSQCRFIGKHCFHACAGKSFHPLRNGIPRQCPLPDAHKDASA